MNPNSQKNQGLIKQFPFVADILSTRMEPYGGSRDDAKRAGWVDRAMKVVDQLTIKVEKADGDLMFRRANNCGLGDSSYVFQLSGNRKDQVMRRGEYLFAIDDGGKIINRVNWPRNEDERRTTGEIYGYFVLWSGRGRFANGETCLTDPIWSKVKFLVWVTVEAWHTDTKNDDADGSRFGEFRDRLIHVTIYGEPEHGFEKLQEQTSVYENLSLDSRVMTRGVIDKNHDIITIGGMLYELCISFQDEVYNNGMREILRKNPYQGASGQFGPLKILCAEMCGRQRIMLEDANCYLTLQGPEESTRLSVLGQQGTLPQIRNLVRTAVKLWNTRPDLRSGFRPDEKVSVM